MHGGKSTGPRSGDGKRVVRQNATKHGLYADSLVFLDNMPAETRAQFEDMVQALVQAEFRAQGRPDDAVSPADLITARDLVLADLIATRGIEYLLQEWKTQTDDRGTPFIAQGEALSQWGSLARLKASLRAALRTNTGRQGDPTGNVAAEARRRLQDLFPRDDGEEEGSG